MVAYPPTFAVFSRVCRKEGLVRDGTRWLFYYGGADKYVGVASVAVH
jgi:predicted GH43/DUF377 family glycosyl hydrolase